MSGQNVLAQQLCYVSRMPTPSSTDPFAGDPFLEAFDRLPDSQLLKEQQVAALTQISADWFQKRRAQGRTPPFWVAPTPDLIRYPVGPLRSWLATLMKESAAAAEPDPMPTPILADPRERLSKEEMAALQLPTLKGGRRKASQSSFSSFLQHAAPTDEWLFELVGPFGRPVDFAESLALDLPDGEACEWLKLFEYVAALVEAARGEQASREAQEHEVELGAGKPGKDIRF